MPKLPLTLLLALLSSFGFAQKQDPFRIDSLPAQGVLLDKGWTWHRGDNPAWAKPDVDDARWDTLNPTQDISSLTKLPRQDIG